VDDLTAAGLKLREPAKRQQNIVTEKFSHPVFAASQVAANKILKHDDN